MPFRLTFGNENKNGISPENCIYKLEIFIILCKKKNIKETKKREKENKIKQNNLLFIEFEREITKREHELNK